MTRLIRFANNATSRLAANLSAVGTTISLIPGDGSKFPALTAGQYFMATLVKSDGTKEVVKVTARSTDTLTVVRAAEAVGGVQTAYSFSAADKIELRLTAESIAGELDRLDRHALTGVLNKSADYTAVEADASSLIRVDSSAAARTITLPLISSLTDDFIIAVAKVSSDSNAVYVAGSGGNTINGSSPYAIVSQWQGAWLVADRATNTWTAVSSGVGSSYVFVDKFTGTGSQTAFTLSAGVYSSNQVDVTISGVTQDPGTDFTATGTALTFTSAPPASATILARYTQSAAQITSGTCTIERQVATAGQTGFALANGYRPGSNTMQVFVNGLLMTAGVDYTETGANSVSFGIGLAFGDEVQFVVYGQTVASADAANVGFTQAGTGAVTRTVQAELREWVKVTQFGAVGDGVANDTAAIWNAIISLRANPVSILDTIGGSLITAYSSGVVLFPPGIYKISADQLQISQDLGLTLRGSGSRRTNNAVRAATTLLVSGTSSGFGIQAYRNGGRGLTIEDMDICYETSAFTGSLLDVYDSPGPTCNRVFFGTYGITGATRLQTASACVRSTYDEFMTFNNCVFDGAVDGWWSDDTRTALGNSFGGSNTFFNNCVFYDFTGNQVRHDGNRTRTGVGLYGCAFNPISVNCVRSVNFTNIDGLCIDTNHFTPSTTFKASTEWMKASNCTGSIVNNSFDDLSKAGTIDGMLEVSGNRVFCTDGFTATGGVVTGRSNEFSQGTNGWTISPTYAICVDLGPDLFKVGVTGRSYDIPADSANLAGRINYDSASDSSASKFRNTSGRIQIANVDGKSFAVSSTPYTVSILDTGRTILATGGSAQTFTLPTPTPGTTITITKLSSVNLNVNCAGGTNYYGVGTASYTGAALTGATYGTLVLEAYATVGWIVKSQVNSWTFT